MVYAVTEPSRLDDLQMQSFGLRSKEHTPHSIRYGEINTLIHAEMRTNGLQKSLVSVLMCAT